MSTCTGIASSASHQFIARIIVVSFYNALRLKRCMQRITKNMITDLIDNRK